MEHGHTISVYELEATNPIAFSSKSLDGQKYIFSYIGGREKNKNNPNA